MRTNHSGVTEVAHIRTNLKDYEDGWERVFGKKNEEKKDDVVNNGMVEDSMPGLRNQCGPSKGQELSSDMPRVPEQE